MHASVENPSAANAEAKAESKLASMRLDAEAVFAHGKKDSFSHKELVELIASTFNLKAAGARRRLENWFKAEVVIKDGPSYLLKR